MKLYLEDKDISYKDVGDLRITRVEGEKPELFL
jgi:hypothetical protein